MLCCVLSRSVQYRTCVGVPKHVFGATSTSPPHAALPRHPAPPPRARLQVKELLYYCPGMLYEFGEEQVVLAERVFERNRTKYAFLGSYEV